MSDLTHPSFYMIKQFDVSVGVLDIKRALIEILLDNKDKFPNCLSKESLIESNIGPLKFIPSNNTIYWLASEQFAKIVIKHVKALIEDEAELFRISPMYVRKGSFPAEDERQNLCIFLPREKVVRGGYEVPRAEWVNVLKTKIAIMSNFGLPPLHQCIFSVPRTKVGGIVKVSFSPSVPLLNIVVMKLMLTKSFWYEWDDQGKWQRMDIIWNKKDHKLKQVQKGKKKERRYAGGKVINYQ